MENRKIKQLSKQEAYKKYRDDPSKFFEERLHVLAKDESALINPQWPKFWTKYHYNLVENGIMEILVDANIELECPSILDIGIGTGHWIDFYAEYFDVSELWGVDFCDAPLERLKRKKIGPNVKTLNWDISSPIPKELLNKKYDIINAIGVMFHIVDDAKWDKAFSNITSLLKRRGIAIIGGDFGKKTIKRGVMRKSRSFDTWKRLTQKYNTEICFLKRYNWWAGADKGGITDNLLAIVLKEADSSANIL